MSENWIVVPAWPSSSEAPKDASETDKNATTAIPWRFNGTRLPVEMQADDVIDAVVGVVDADDLRGLEDLLFVQAGAAQGAEPGFVGFGRAHGESPGEFGERAVARRQAGAAPGDGDFLDHHLIHAVLA